VSYEYWKTLTYRYSQYLTKEKNSDAINYSILAGNIDSALEMLIRREEYEDAKLINILKIMGKYKEEEISNAPESKVEYQTPDMKQLSSDKLMLELSWKESDKYLKEGLPLLSCCSNLSINDINGAMINLIRANELCFAYVLYLLFPKPEFGFIISKQLGTLAEANGLMLYAKQKRSSQVLFSL
jgi:hypothetical protein